MHREISHTDSAFAEESNWRLYLMTGLLAALLALDLLPRFGDWAGLTAFQSWPKDLGTFWGVRVTFGMLAAILGGARVLYVSLIGFLDGKIGADIAIAIAFLAAIFISEWLVAAEVVFIGMFGECLEAFTFDRTKNAIRKLVEVFPIRCWVLKDGQETRVFTKDVQIGDHVVVKPGAKVPVDGVVLNGRSAVDASALTGESIPLDKEPGNEVLAGSINQFGALTIEAKRVAQQTVAGRVIELTAKALKEKGNLERTADRMARYFLPIVLGIAAFTFLACFFYYGTPWFQIVGAQRLGLRQALTRAVYPALSVLVVACPCALILATPAAVIAALGRLAGTGVLIKSGAALERLANVGAFAFDKTGTITEGKLELGDVICLSEIAPDDLVRIAASAEQRSEHPLARLIVQEAMRRQLALDEIQDFHAHPGAGVAAQTNAGRILIGTRRLLEEQGITITDATSDALARFDAAGQTPLLVARDGIVIGALGARDRLRPEAQLVLKQLRDLGIDPIVLLTGDRAAAAKAIAQDLAFSQIHAELLPEQKVQFLDGLRTRTAGVAMVGDGINDAPALAHADVGIAIGSTGSDIAAEAGDIVLMGDPLKQLPLLVKLSRQTVAIINQNILWFAYVVNAVGIIVTAWLWPLFAPDGWYEQSPVAAVIYHQLGSFLVLVNSMRLLWFERRSTSPTIIAWEGRLQGVDEWVSRNLDTHEFAHWCQERWHWLTLGTALVIALLYFASGLTIIAPDEVAIVRRFGNQIEGDLNPGWHWRYPYPIEETTRVSQKVRTVNIGFKESTAVQSGALTWSSAHRMERDSNEAMMITGDGNLADLLVSVRFKVTKPRVYLFQVSNADEILRASAESELRAMVAGRSFLDLLTAQRGKFQDDVLERVKARCDSTFQDGLGIEIDGISIIDLHPPKEVVASYYDVARKMEERDQRINEAEERVIKKQKDADADVVKILAQARAAKTEKIQEAERDRSLFLAQYRPRVDLSLDAELDLAMKAAQQLFAGARIDDVATSYHVERGEKLAQLPELVDFRLYWDAVSRSLSGRKMLLIDSDKALGRRNFLLFDPEQFRMPFPMILPQERVPRTPFRPDMKEDN